MNFKGYSLIQWVFWNTVTYEGTLAVWHREGLRARFRDVEEFRRKIRSEFYSALPVSWFG
jgi:hypothetical protein